MVAVGAAVGADEAAAVEAPALLPPYPRQAVCQTVPAPLLVSLQLGLGMVSRGCPFPAVLALAPRLRLRRRTRRRKQ